MDVDAYQRGEGQDMVMGMTGRIIHTMGNVFSWIWR